MDEHDGKSARPIWSESDQPCGFLVEQIADQEAAQFAAPDLRIAQAIGERGGTLDLERNILSAEAHRLGVRRGVDLQSGVHGPGCELPAGVGDAQHGGDRDFHSRSDLKSMLGIGQDTAGGERRADAGLTIGVAQAVDLELVDRDKIDQLAACPDQACRVERDTQACRMAGRIRPRWSSTCVPSADSNAAVSARL